MTGTSDRSGCLWATVLERFEQQAPASVMARTLLEQALPASWLDTVFAKHRGRQYERDLLFSTIVELMMLVVVGMRPSVHAAARQSESLPVSLKALYDKLKRTEPALLGALVRASADRLAPVLSAVDGEDERDRARLPGYALRVIDGNHLPASEKRLKALREQPGAALPGQAIVVYDPEGGLVTDLVAGEDAHEGERALASALLERAGPGQVFIADRHFCPGSLLRDWEASGANFIVREHARHPRLSEKGAWCACGRTDTGRLREQTITLAHTEADQGTGQTTTGQTTTWRRIELRLDRPTEAGERVVKIWSNLPASVTATTIAQLYRDRWRIEGMFQRLESVLHSEVSSLGHPRAALLGFAVALLDYNVLALIERCIERVHAPAKAASAEARDDTPADASATEPAVRVSLFHLALLIRSGYEGLRIALPPEHPTGTGPHDPKALGRVCKGFTSRRGAPS